MCDDCDDRLFTIPKGDNFFILPKGSGGEAQLSEEAHDRIVDRLMRIIRERAAYSAEDIAIDTVDALVRRYGGLPLARALFDASVVLRFPERPSRLGAELVRAEILRR